MVLPSSSGKKQHYSWIS